MVSVNMRLEQARLHKSWWGGNKPQAGASSFQKHLAGLPLHVAFGKWELLPVGKAEVDSVFYLLRKMSVYPICC